MCVQKNAENVPLHSFLLTLSASSLSTVIDLPAIWDHMLNFHPEAAGNFAGDRDSGRLCSLVNTEVSPWSTAVCEQGRRTSLCPSNLGD